MATLGFENLALSWDQYNSRTASRFWRVQYTTNGTTWIDHQSVINTNASSWVRFHVSFDGVSLDNRSYLSIRLVPEFESTATGAGAEMRQAMGIAVAMGMAGVTLLGLLLTPAFYLLVRRAAEYRRRRPSESEVAPA